MTSGRAILSVVPDILGSAPGDAGRASDLRNSEMVAKGKRCEPDCTCGLHNRPKMSPEEARARQIERVRQYQAANREKVAAYQREYRQRYRQTAAFKEGETVRQRRYRTGLEPEQLTELWDAQQGLCYMCGEVLDLNAKRGFVVDHDHSHCRGHRSCGACVLGLACDACNVGCGRFGDDEDRMERAAAARRAAKGRVAETLRSIAAQPELLTELNKARRRREESA